MRCSNIFIAATAVSLLAGHAVAQETEAPAADDSTGIRAEASIGYDRISDVPLDGVRAGGAIGYDLPIGKTFTIGAEAGVGWMVAGHQSFVTSGSSNEGLAYKVSGGHDLDFSVRLGAKLGASTLVFAKAGWADASYRFNLISPSEATVYGHSDNGIRLGVGLEQKLGKHLYAKAEYRYTTYGERDEVNPKRHQFLTGFGVRF